MFFQLCSNYLKYLLSHARQRNALSYWQLPSELSCLDLNVILTEKIWISYASDLGLGHAVNMSNACALEFEQLETIPENNDSWVTYYLNYNFLPRGIHDLLPQLVEGC